MKLLESSSSAMVLIDAETRGITKQVIYHQMTNYSGEIETKLIYTFIEKGKDGRKKE